MDRIIITSSRQSFSRVHACVLVHQGISESETKSIRRQCERRSMLYRRTLIRDLMATTPDALICPERPFKSTSNITYTYSVLLTSFSVSYVRATWNESWFVCAIALRVSLTRPVYHAIRLQDYVSKPPTCTTRIFKASGKHALLPPGLPGDPGSKVGTVTCALIDTKHKFRTAITSHEMKHRKRRDDVTQHEYCGMRMRSPFEEAGGGEKVAARKQSASLNTIKHVHRQLWRGSVDNGPLDSCNMQSCWIP